MTRHAIILGDAGASPQAQLHTRRVSGVRGISNVKHEFLDGQIYAMAGGTPEHAALAAAVITLLGPQLRGGDCRPYNSDLRVRTPTGLTTYPDVTVICGSREIDGIDALAITNPALIVEVLSRSTEEYDSGDKFEHYKTFPSLREYVLVSHREHSVEVRSRGEDGWRTTVVHEGASAELSVGSQAVGVATAGFSPNNSLINF